MTSQQHVSVDAKAFDPASIPEDVHEFNRKLMTMMKGAPMWWEVGAARYRQMREKGETPLPALKMLDSGKPYSVPSRDSGREIPCRLLGPQNGQPPKAVLMHIHGGGWVLSSERSQDAVLQELADDNQLLCLSVGYRLAPEHPFPAGPDDCFDVACWLIDNAQKEFGAPLAFICGESAGGHLSMVTALSLLQSSTEKYADYRLKGLILHFGCFDLTLSGPSTHLFKPAETLVLDLEIMEHFIEVTVPGCSFGQLRSPSISPMFADLEALRGRLPPALYTCGTYDPLLDDTVLMSARWQQAGAETEVLIVPGACHGYCMFPRNMKGAQADIAMDRVDKFIVNHLQ